MRRRASSTDGYGWCTSGGRFIASMMNTSIGTSARSPAARTRPTMPMRRKISMVRALQRSIFGRNCGASLRSTSVQRTPFCPRSIARTSPTGPAPTMRTSVSSKRLIIMSRMRWFFAAISCFIGVAFAQDYPARTVHLVVPYTPGTGADLLARMLGPRLGERWKVAVVTENKPGATGNIGTEFVAKSAPDGYTLLFVATSFGTTPALRGSLPFDPVKSFAPVGLVATSGLVVVAHPQLAARSMKEFIELAKREPGRMHYS